MAQGQKSSPDLRSFYVSDIPKCTDTLESNDSVDPNIMAQFANDTALLAEQLECFKENSKCLQGYSSSNYQIPNITKTIFCNFSANPKTTPITKPLMLMFRFPVMNFREVRDTYE